MRAAISFGLACSLLSASAAAQDFRNPVETVNVLAHVDHGPHGENAVSDYQCGTTTYAGHTGTDFAAPGGSAVMASADGWVVRSEEGHPNNNSPDLPEGYLSGDLPAGCGGSSYSDAPGGGFGNHVVVLHPDGAATLYGHLQGAQAAWGAPVTCGDRVGNVGLSGCTSGYHVHFEVRTGVSTTSAGFCSNTHVPAGTKVDPFAGDCNVAPGAQMTASCTSATAEELDALSTICGGWSVDQLRFLDETLDDGTVLDPEVTPTVAKTWTIQNSGMTTWDPAAGYELRFVGDVPGSCSAAAPDRLGGAAVVALPSPIEPGGEVTLQVTLSVPDAEGSYRGAWRMWNGQQYFGSCIWFEISVGGDEPRAGCVSPTLGGVTVRDGDYVQASNGGCGHCSWQRCTDGAWECGDVSEVEPHRTAHATCSEEEVDPPPPSGDTTYPSLPKVSSPTRAKSGCFSKTAGAWVASGECVQVGYAACGATGCGVRSCDDGKWVCASGSAACTAMHGTGSCSSCEDCEHGECETGGPLPSASSACANAVCTTLPECCASSGAWDEACVSKAASISGACRGVCYDGESSCSHSECEAGAALSPSCSTCAASVCEDDPFCCENKWDDICAGISAKRSPYCACDD